MQAEEIVVVVTVAIRSVNIRSMTTLDLRGHRH
jgi:hypothetical protein